MVARFKENTFTPHARGSTQWVCHLQRRKRIYPACAGINPTARSIVTMLCNLPRMRGDHPMQILGDGFVLKFTPQARGSTQFDMPPARRASIYPACAGINPHLGQIVLICLHLPRMRGDQPLQLCHSLHPCPFTPHARDHPQPIVAYTTFKDLPRVCGDQPGYTFVLDYWCEFPPRARGSA